MKTFVMCDIHGNHRGMLQCLERANFDYENDKLIFLGDIVDGNRQVSECFDEILKIRNLVMILGNHDDWALEFYSDPDRWNKIPRQQWVNQGGDMTLGSYNYDDMPEDHLNLLKSAKLYHIENGILYTHGGIDPWESDMEKQDRQTFLWDRELISLARKHHSINSEYKLAGFREIYVGHTTTQYFEGIEPLHYCNVRILDTGGGWNGKLTIMDIETNEYWQSDLTHHLYPEYSHRG